MSLARLVLNMIMGPMYVITLLFPIKSNKIAFISLSSEKLEGDFKIIARKLEEHPEYEVVSVLAFCLFLCAVKTVVPYQYFSFGIIGFQ